MTTEKKQAAPVAEALAAKAAKAVKEAKEVKDAVVKEVKEVKAAKKPAARKPAAKKAQPKVSVTFQYMGREITAEAAAQMAQEAWGGKSADIKTMELYVKPEDAAIYYVINGSEQGKAAL